MDGQTDKRINGGDYNIAFAVFLKKSVGIIKTLFLRLGVEILHEPHVCTIMTVGPSIHRISFPNIPSCTGY